ncbi:hypothetical protein ACFX13_023497 [Malus domestica]
MEALTKKELTVVICLSYFPVNQSHSNRQRTLAEDYGFDCQYDCCKVEASWSDNEEGEEEAEGMDEDQDQEMEASSESEPKPEIDIEETKAKAQGEPDFPHAYFFVRFMCNRTNCWGTLALLPPKDDGSPSNVMECNVCGSLKKDEHS